MKVEPVARDQQILAADFQTIAENVKLAWQCDTSVGWGWLADEVAKRCAEEVAKGRATPEGYALVRVEPTEAMIQAMVKAVYGPATFKVTPATVEMENMRDAFQAAIGAAKGE